MQVVGGAIVESEKPINTSLNHTSRLLTLPSWGHPGPRYERHQNAVWCIKKVFTQEPNSMANSHSLKRLEEGLGRYQEMYSNHWKMKNWREVENKCMWKWKLLQVGKSTGQNGSTFIQFQLARRCVVFVHVFSSVFRTFKAYSQPIVDVYRSIISLQMIYFWYILKYLVCVWRGVWHNEQIINVPFTVPITSCGAQPGCMRSACDMFQLVCLWSHARLTRQWKSGEYIVGEYSRKRGQER